MRSVGINVRFTLGAGPIFLLPTATDELLGAGKWAAGPTGVVVWQGNDWAVAFSPGTTRLSLAKPTAPMSTKHSCSPSAPIRQQAWTFTLQGEDTYNWETGEWLAPVNFLVSKIIKVGGQPV